MSYEKGKLVHPSPYICNSRIRSSLDDERTFIITGTAGTKLSIINKIYGAQANNAFQILDNLKSIESDITQDFFVFRNGVGCSSDVYTKDGVVDWSIVNHLYLNENATIYLRALQKYIPTANDLVKVVQKDFSGYRAFINLFITPQHSVGLKAHLDPTDFFVYQAAGEKVWKFWRRPNITELKNYSLRQRAKLALEIARDSSEIYTLTLRAGQVLYVPQFQIHAPLTENNFSVHYTIGLASPSMKEYYD